MPVVNREVVLPCDRERAWELITEPSELEEWLGVEVTPDVAWDHPTAHAVSIYLGGSTTDAPAADASSVSALLSELEES